jgi:hypothetical protein
LPSLFNDWGGLLRRIWLATLALLLTAGWDSCGHARTTEDPHNAIVAALAPYGPPLVTRDKWQARPALTGVRPQTPSAIIIHHTGEHQNRKLSIEAKLRNLQSFSQRPGMVSPGHSKPAWPDVPYHFYIDVNGRVAEGRDVRLAGDTNTGYDTRGYIQVVIEGDFEKEQPTPEQMNALRDSLVWLTLLWGIPVERISVHKDHASTDCPGRNLLALLPSLRIGIIARRSAVLADLCARSPNSIFSLGYCRER